MTDISDQAAAWGARAATLLETLAAASAPGPGVTRLPFTPEHRAALDLLRHAMETAGLDTRLDAAGTLIGRREGRRPGAPTFLIGSHQDSVPQGGAYDGIMGVVLGLLALEHLAARGIDLPFAVEILAFADEEGVRFPTALMGPRALAGRFDPAALALTDRAGIPLGEAMREFGLVPEALGTLQRPTETVLGYLECHIEQGPVLESEGRALGVVTAICGIERHQITLAGQAGHAGTTPMDLRRDALAGAAELIAAAEAAARARDALLATVGWIEVSPNAVNAIPGEARLTLELRSPRDATREAAGAELADAARRIAARRGLKLEMRRSYAQSATACDPALTNALAAAVAATTGAAARHLPSGATHDASAMADLCPVAMLFTACRGGISHNPAELAAPADMGQAVLAIAEFLRQIATLK